MSSSLVPYNGIFHEIQGLTIPSPSSHSVEDYIADPVVISFADSRFALVPIGTSEVRLTGIDADLQGEANIFALKEGSTPRILIGGKTFTGKVKVLGLLHNISDAPMLAGWRNTYVAARAKLPANYVNVEKIELGALSRDIMPFSAASTPPYRDIPVDEWDWIKAMTTSDMPITLLYVTRMQGSATLTLLHMPSDVPVQEMPRLISRYQRFANFSDTHEPDWFANIFYVRYWLGMLK